MTSVKEDAAAGGEITRFIETKGRCRRCCTNRQLGIVTAGSRDMTKAAASSRRGGGGGGERVSRSFRFRIKAVQTSPDPPFLSSLLPAVPSSHNLFNFDPLSTSYYEVSHLSCPTGRPMLLRRGPTVGLVGEWFRRLTASFV